MTNKSVLNNRSVLIVEDEAVVALALETLLRSEGVEIVGPAASLEEAVKLLGQRQIDVALLDVNLNGKFSFDLATRFDQANVPFVVITGYEQEFVNRHLANAVVVPKPYDGAELIRTLHEAIERKTPADEWRCRKLDR